MKLSIGMMVKNEEKNLERCLKSLQPILDVIDSELIIVDTGSTDRTVEIAKQYTDKVYFHQWNNNFSEMRNITINYAKGDWFFVIDADEKLEKPEYIIEFLNHKENRKYNTVLMAVKSYTKSEEIQEFSTLKSTRLFKRDKDLKYIGAVHNQPQFKMPLVQINSEIVHYGYMSHDTELMENKFQRTCMMLKSELEKDPENIYYRYQLSVTYGMHGDFKENLEEAIKAYECVKKNENDFIPYLYVFNELCQAYIANKMFVQAEEIAKEAISIDDTDIDAYMYLGKMFFGTNRYKEAKESYEKYLYLVENYNTSLSVRDLTIVYYTVDKTEIAYSDLFVIHLENNEIDEAIKYLDKTNDHDILDNNMQKIVNLLIESDKLDYLKNFYIFKDICNTKVLYKTFVAALEDKLKTVQTEKKMDIISLFIHEDGNYDLLNKVRLAYAYKNDNLINNINELVNRIDLNNSIDFFGDIFYIMMSTNNPIEDLFMRVSEANMNTYIKFIIDCHEDAKNKINQYLLNRPVSNELNFVKTAKILRRALLSVENLPNEDYLNIFKKYINDGISYMEIIYNKKIIENELIYDVKNDEEIFFLYMYNAERLYKNNELEYIKCLRKALEKVPMMKRGIELILEEIKQNQSNENPEMRRLKTQLKGNIKTFIKSGNIEIAEALIKEYESIVSDDIEIVLFKSQIGVAKLKQGSSSEYKM